MLHAFRTDRPAQCHHVDTERKLILLHFSLSLKNAFVSIALVVKSMFNAIAYRAT